MLNFEVVGRVDRGDVDVAGRDGHQVHISPHISRKSQQIYRAFYTFRTFQFFMREHSRRCCKFVFFCFAISIGKCVQ